MELSNIEITDADIDEIEAVLGNVSFDEERRRIIKCLDTVDIQAFPGTGKTTVLVAKLAILAKKWPYANKGICVLSHTNVAREEIEKRLGNTPVGQKLLSYPHYIGTIHSFADAFLALPFLRSNGYPVSLIDTQIVLKKRFESLNDYTRAFLNRHYYSESKCESSAYPISIDINAEKLTKETYLKSYISNIINTIDKSQKEGCFTFNEMLCLANYLLSKSALVSKGIQDRFPLLLIDEAQDTNSLQWGIINSAFSVVNSKSIIQRFGDANQAIYESYITNDSGIDFPNANPLTISNSLRFGSDIANLINPLAIKGSGTIVGDNKTFDKNNCNNTIIVFDDDHIQDVLPKYGSIVLESFSDDELALDNTCGIYAVGMIHKKEQIEDDNNKFPFCVKDYYPSYDANANRFIKTPNLLIDFFRAGVKNNSFSELVESVANGIRHIINAYQAKRIVFKKTSFNSLCQLIPEKQLLSFRKEFYEIIKFPFDSETEWTIISKSIVEFCSKWFGIDVSASKLLIWFDRTEHTEKKPENVFSYTDSSTGRTVNINIGSIHSQKGRTHIATLVLETYWYDPNIDHILDWLINNPSKKTPGTRDSMRLKCHYVALSRAKGLICIALPKKRITTEKLEGLKSVGWRVIQL